MQLYIDELRNLGHEENITLYFMSLSFNFLAPQGCSNGSTELLQLLKWQAGLQSSRTPPIIKRIVKKPVGERQPEETTWEFLLQHSVLLCWHRAGKFAFVSLNSSRFLISLQK